MEDGLCTKLNVVHCSYMSLVKTGGVKPGVSCAGMPVKVRFHWDSEATHKCCDARNAVIRTHILLPIWVGFSILWIRRTAESQLANINISWNNSGSILSSSNLLVLMISVCVLYIITGFHSIKGFAINMITNYIVVSDYESIRRMSAEEK